MIATIGRSAYGTNYLAYVLKDGKESIAGFMFIMKEVSLLAGGTIIWINDTFVPNEYRRQGVFAAFFDDLLKEAISDPMVVGIRLCVDQSNIPAQKCYSRLGMCSIMDEFDFNGSDLLAPIKADSGGTLKLGD